MIAKEEKQLVRFAIRHRWLSAEEGEDVLFLRNKFGPKYSIPELIRRRQYLNDTELESLLTEADFDVQRRQNRTGIFRLSALSGARPKSKPVAAPKSKPRRSLKSPGPAAQSESQGTPISKASPRRPRRKLNALSAAPQARKPEISASPSHLQEDAANATQPESPVVASEASPDHTIIDASFMDQLQAMRSEISFDERTDESNAAVVSATDRSDSEQQVEDNANDPAERTVIGFIPDFGAIENPPPVASVEEQEYSDAATVALSSLDIQEALAAQSPETHLFAESPINRQDVVPPSDMVVPPSNELNLVREQARRRRKTSSMRAEPLSVPSEESPAPPQFDALRQPSGEMPSVRSRSELHAALNAAVSDSDELKMGDVLGAYRIVRAIARGEFATLYLAQMSDSGETAAIKVLKSSARQNGEFVARFVRESQAAMGINSPNVVRILELAEDRSRVFSVLQYVEGWSLKERLETGEPIELIEALRIAHAISCALEATSAVGLVHRDVKPANILLGHDGAVYLTDFGLATELSEQTRIETGSPEPVLGTPAYMSPEQACGRPMDGRSDLYGLGATLFRILSGHDVYPGNSSISIITKHVSHEIPELRTIDDHIPEDVSQLVFRLLAKSAAERYQSAAELSQSLAHLIRGLGTVERPLTRFGEELLESPSLIKRSAIFGIGGLLLALGLAIGIRYFIPDSIARSNFILHLSFGAAGNLVLAVFLFSGLGLIRRGELPLPGASAFLLKLKDLTCATGGVCLCLSLLLGPPSMIRIFAGVLGVTTWATLVYGVILRRSVAQVRFDGGAGRTLAILGDPRLAFWSRCHGLVLVTVGAVSAIKFALLKYFQASGLN